jgi:Putative adhesin
MKRAIVLSLLILPALVGRSNDDWWQEDRETIHKNFQVAPGENATRLVSDQINGPIRVTGGSGSEIRITVEKRIKAEMRSDLEEARHDVKLEITQEGNTVRLYEDNPSRHGDGWRRHHYSVVFECDIEVPTGVALDLQTMNGTVEVRNVSGDYRVHTMNGKVEMDGIGGTGNVETMNGSVHVAFNRNPTRESSFHTMNGSVDVYFRSEPDADFNIETMHGGVYADFDVTTLPTTVKGEISNSRYVYRTGGNMKVRAGKGGPQISLHTMNGSINLHSHS